MRTTPVRSCASEIRMMEGGIPTTATSVGQLVHNFIIIDPSQAGLIGTTGPQFVKAEQQQHIEDVIMQPGEQHQTQCFVPGQQDHPPPAHKVASIVKKKKGLENNGATGNSSNGTTKGHRKRSINRGRWTKDEDDRLKRYGHRTQFVVFNILHFTSTHARILRILKACGLCIERKKNTVDDNPTRRVVQFIGSYSCKQEIKYSIIVSVCGHLCRLVLEHSEENMSVISRFFPDRSVMQCQTRWSKVLSPNLIKGQWTKEEDDKVVRLVNQYGPKKWTLIAKHLKGRIGKQCRER